ncbi:MAG: DUF2493 domain-containing protein [Caulobacteraceae bacterium]
MRVLVCGGRDYQDRRSVYAALDEALADPDCDQQMPVAGALVIHGNCRTGADAFADDWAIANWCPTLIFYADWHLHGKAAGPIRNQQMIDGGEPDLVLAFPGGRGTADMVRRARAAGIKVREIPTPPTGER